MEIKVSASKPYNILIGSNILGEVATFLASEKAKKVCIITDTGVPYEYIQRIENALQSVDKTVVKYIFEQGEQSKTIDVWSNILGFLAENNFTRTDALVAVGGGIVGDMTGFVASSYMRGIKFVQVPTTLLAQIDSSIGGKTGVNLKQGKNLVGAFYQPSFVVCDTATLKTLPEEQIKNGLGEGVKYACMNKTIYSLLCEENVDFDKFIYECILQKKDVVEKDETECGVRKFLNFGHTFGHAIEKLSNFEVNHGLAVAKGVALAMGLSVKLSLFSKTDEEKVLCLMKKLKLDYNTKYTFSQMLEIMKIDKKASGNSVCLVLVKNIGELMLQDFTFAELENMCL